MHRHELDESQWQAVRPYIKHSKAKTGRKAKDPRVMLNAILWVLRTGAPWRDLPERYGKWQTVYHYFCRWRGEGTYARILKALQVKLDAAGQIDWDLFCVDGTSVRGSRAAAGASKKASNATETSRKTTHWVAREAGSAASSTWSLTVRDYP